MLPRQVSLCSGQAECRPSVALILRKPERGERTVQGRGTVSSCVSPSPSLCCSGSHSEEAAFPQDNRPSKARKEGKKRGPTKMHGKKPPRGQRAGSQDHEALS